METSLSLNSSNASQAYSETPIFVNSNPKKIQINSSHGNFIYSVFDNVIALGCEDGYLSICDRKTGQQLHQAKAHDFEILSLKKVGNTLLSASKDVVKIWDLNRANPFEKPISTGKLLIPNEVIQEVNFDGTYVVAHSKILDPNDFFNAQAMSRICDIKTNSSATLKGYYDKCSFSQGFGIFEGLESVIVCDLNKKSIVALRKTTDTCGWAVHQNQLLILNEEKKLTAFTPPHLNQEWQADMPFSEDLYFYKRVVCFRNQGECHVFDVTNGQIKELAKFSWNGSEDFTLKVYNSCVTFISECMIGFFKTDGSNTFMKLLDWDYKTWTKVKIVDDVLYFIDKENNLNIFDYNNQDKN